MPASRIPALSSHLPDSAACAGLKPERPPLAQTAAGKRPDYFDSRPRTISPPAQTAAPRNFQSGKAAEIFLLSRDRHAVQQVISECAHDLSELLDIVTETMPTHRYSDSLNVPYQNHFS